MPLKIIGHRGARNEAPENTKEGFIHAQKNGCLHFELDIQLSSDHELVVYHDTSLKRTSGINGHIGTTTFEVLQKTDARLDTPGWDTPCYIPTLQSVIDAVPATLSWQFEVKKDTNQRMLILLEKLEQFMVNNALFDKATVTSSHKDFLAQFKRKNPEIKTGYVAEYAHNKPVKSALKLECSLLILKENLASNKRIQDAKNHDLEVSCWTVNDIQRMEQLHIMNVASIITDIPTKAIKHFS